MTTQGLATTCEGYSLQKAGGYCPRREDCRRYLYHLPGKGYPQESFLCAVKKWDWFAPIESEKKSNGKI